MRLIAEYVTAEEFKELSNTVTLQSKETEILKTKVDTLTLELKTFIKSSINEASDIQFSKMREYISSAIDNKFQKEDYKRLKEKEENSNDLKKHAKKSAIQNIVAGAFGLIAILYAFFSALSSRENQMLLNDYERRIVEMQEKLDEKGD